MARDILTDKQKKVLNKVVNTLNSARIPFQVSGGLAAIAYGATRPLYDIDLDVAKKDIKKVQALFCNYIVQDFYRLQDKNFDIYLLTLKIDGMPVDIGQAEYNYFSGKDGNRIRLDADLAKAKFVNIEGIEVPVEDKSELIKYKTVMSRPTDLEDIAEIKKASLKKHV